MTWQFFGLNFHLYGLIIGLAIVLGFYLAEKKAAEYKVPQSCVWKLGVAAVLLGLIGARLWHVATDFHLYQSDFLAVAAIWDGGLSIFGGIAGGLVGLCLGRAVVKECRQRPVVFFADLAAFALPASQGLGRLANWVNGELYGLPTNLPWKIYIAPENRLAGYENTAYYHPLFLYEMVLMLGFSVWIWNFDRLNTLKKRKLGGGFYTWIYLSFYAAIRFFLDFLRPGKATFLDTSLGVNQLLMAIILLILLAYGLRRFYFSTSKKIMAGAFVLIVIAAAFLGLSSSAENDSKKLSAFQLGDHLLEVEVVSTPDKMALGLSGRPEIGSDGMLFIFPSPTRAIFWMKDMFFDLDMIWIRNGKVIDITRDVPKPSPGTDLRDLPKYSPVKPADMILEVPAGKAADLNISTGSAAALVK